jgi:hypothetical protein
MQALRGFWRCIFVNRQLGKAGFGATNGGLRVALLLKGACHIELRICLKT